MISGEIKHNLAREHFKTCKKHASMCEWVESTLHKGFNFSKRFNLMGS